MTLAVENVESLLNQLSVEELDRVRKKISVQLNVRGGVGAPGTVRPSRRDDWLLDGLLHELRKQGLLPSTSTPPINRVSPGYAAAAEAVREELSRAFNPALRPPEAVALGRLVASALVSYLRRREITASPRTLLNNVDKALVAVDESFPGYLRAGLLRMCWSVGHGR